MAQKIDEYKTKLNSALNDNTKPWKAVLDFAEEKTNVPRLYLFAGKPMRNQFYSFYRNIIDRSKVHHSLKSNQISLVLFVLEISRSILCRMSF